MGVHRRFLYLLVCTSARTSSSECILDAHRCHVVFLDQNGSRFLVLSSREQSTAASQSRLGHTLFQTCASSPLFSLVARRPNHSPRVRSLARNWTFSRIPLWICGTLKWGWAQAPTSILLDGCQVRVRLTCRRTAWVCSQRSWGPVAFVRPFMLAWTCLATSYSWGTRSGLRLRLLSLPPRDCNGGCGSLRQAAQRLSESPSYACSSEDFRSRAQFPQDIRAMPHASFSLRSLVLNHHWRT